MRTYFRAILAALISGCAFSFCLPASAVSADSKRFALLFGNGHYRHAEGLRDPVADVTDLSASLARAGYAVRVVVDADYGAMRAALRDYAKQADGAEAAIVYFAGYGMEMNGEDWLVPVDAELRSESAVENEAVSLKSVVSSVSNAQSLGLVILDAARANPFDADMKKGKDGRSVARGLVGVETPDNVFVAQSAKEGEVAPESAGRLSPFTAALVSRIGEPGLQLEYLFRDVGDEVAAATGRAQEPTLYGDGSDKPAFVVPAGETVAQGPPIAADQIAWSFLEGTNDVASLHAFAEAFPQSTKQGQASARIGALEGVAASPVLAMAVNTDPVVEAPLLLATGVGTAEDAAKLARRFKGDTAEVQKAWAVIAKVGNAKVSNAFQSLFPGVARRTVHAARRPSQAARVAGARRTPFHFARRAPAHSTLPVFVVRPRVTTNPLVALRDDAYAGRRPSPIKRVAVRERDCEARRWYRDVRVDLDDCGVPWGAERRNDGPVALFDSRTFGGGSSTAPGITMAAGVVGPESTSIAPSSASSRTELPPGSTGPSNAQGETVFDRPGQASAVAKVEALQSVNPTVPSNQSPASPPAGVVPVSTVPSMQPASVPLVKNPQVFEQKRLGSSADVGAAAKEVSKPSEPASGSTAASSGKVPGSSTAAPTAVATATPTASGSTDISTKPAGTPNATSSEAKSPADVTAKAPGSSSPSIAANSVAGSTDPAVKAAGVETTTGSTGTVPTSTATTTAGLPAKASGEVPQGGTGAAPTGKAVDIVAATTGASSPGALPTTSGQASPTSGTTAVMPVAMSEVPPASAGPVVVVAPVVTKPMAIVSTGSSVPSDVPKTSSPAVSASPPSTAPTPGVSLGSTGLSASVHPPQNAPTSPVSHVPNHRPSMTSGQPARSTATLGEPVTPSPSTRQMPATAYPDRPVQTVALRSIPHLDGAAHDAGARPAEHRAVVDRSVREPTRAVVVAPVRLRPTFLVSHQALRRELAPTRPMAIPQPFVRSVQRVAPPVRFAPAVQRIEMPRMVRAVVPQIQRIAVPQIQRIAVPQIQRIVVPTIGGAQIARPMMPMIRRPGQ